MSQEIRRLHRQQNQFTNFSSRSSTDSTEHDQTDPLSDSTRPRRRSRTSTQIDEHPKLTSDPNFPNSLQNDYVNSIRPKGLALEWGYRSAYAELQEDFSDDTHDWGGDSQNLSPHYWHFLGSFE